MFETISFLIIMVISIGPLVVFLGYVAWVLFLCDKIFPPRFCTGEGVVLKKWYEPTHETDDLVDTTGGFGMIAHSSRTVSESWRVEVQVEGETERFYVSKKLYDTLSVGESIHVSFMRGRNAKDIYSISILSPAA